MAIELIRPRWDAPANVRAVSTMRHGGVSRGVWASLNLADHVDDDPAAVRENRRRLAHHLTLPAEPAWLRQVHGIEVRRPDSVTDCADACCEGRPGRVCVVMTADGLPVSFCNQAGTRVAAAHAGWRGLLAGVLEATLDCFDEPAEQVMAWLGPAIGPDAFEVGDEVREAFLAQDAARAANFRAHGVGHWLADLYGLARHRLGERGVMRVSGGEYCTFSDTERFFSYRRDGVTGRMATLIWLRS